MSYIIRDPSIEVTSLTSDTCTFILKNSDASIANALRRIMLSEVPIMCIDEVMVFMNDGVMIDEMVSHRLGLVPLVSTHIDKFIESSSCNCIDGCSKCCVLFEINVYNDTDDIRLVTSKDIKWVPLDNLNKEEDEPINKSVIPVTYTSAIENISSDIIITKLAPQQTLQCLAKARKGIAKSHAKWSPVSTSVYTYAPLITINKSILNNLDKENQEKIVKSCPTKVFSYKKGELDIEDINNCMFCQQCVKQSQALNVPNLITIDHNPNVFYFTVESIGSLSPELIVLMAIRVLKTKILNAKV
jgi:DNA-directed RNA polymerase II subunit RPB3